MRPDPNAPRRSSRASRSGDPIRLDERRPGNDPTAEAALVALGLELESAGALARSETRQASVPAVIWAAAIRGRLVGRLPRPESRRMHVAPAAGTTSAAGAAGTGGMGPEPTGKPWLASTKPWAMPLRARTAWQGPRPRPAPLAGLAMAAAVAVVAFLGASTLQFPVAPTAVAGAAVDASLVRDGLTSALARGTELRAGDRILTGARGGATLHIGGGEARVATDAAVEIVALADGSVTIEQLAGRVYHRVALADGGRYVVATGAIRWVAEGTAFDLRRETSAGGLERATLIAVEHDVAIRGEELAARVPQGSVALITLTEGAPEAVAIEPVAQDRLDDPWLLANARADRELGFDVGILSAWLDEPAPTPSGLVAEATPAPEFEPPALATAVPDGSAEPFVGPTPAATAVPAATPRPTARPTPKPTAKPTAPPLPSLSLALTGCHGGVLIDWGQYAGSGFDHYTTLRSSASSIPKAYPPQGGAVDPGGTYTTDKTKTSAVDADVDAGTTVYYRAMAFDAEDRVIAASGVKSVVPKGLKGLGGLEVSGSAASLTFAWAAYDGPGACFDYYKLVYSADDPTPSYLAGAPYLAALESQGASGADGLAMDPGTYHFRLQAIKTTALGKFVVAHTDVTTFSVDP